MYNDIFNTNKMSYIWNPNGGLMEVAVLPLGKYCKKWNYSYLQLMLVCIYA